MKRIVLFCTLLCGVEMVSAQKPLISIGPSGVILNNKIFLTAQTTPQAFLAVFGKPNRTMDLKPLGKALIYDSLGMTFQFDSAQKFRQLIIRYSDWIDLYMPFLPEKRFAGKILAKGSPIGDTTMARKFIQIFPNSVIRMTKDWNNFSLLCGKFRISSKCKFYNFANASPTLGPLDYLILSVQGPVCPVQKFTVLNDEIMLDNKPATLNGYREFRRFAFYDESISEASIGDMQYGNRKDSLEKIFLRSIEEGEKRCRQNPQDKDFMNDVGYQLLYKDHIKEAISVFKLNVEANPDYANGYDSLAEGFLYDQDFKHAAENYKKAYQIEPMLNSLICYELLTAETLYKGK